MIFKNFPISTRYLFGNELAERWSFYGMKGVLIIFLTQYLVNNAGQPDPMSKPEATAWLHTFIAVAYVTPLLGAILADAFFGRYRTIFGLSLIYCIGHFVLAFNEMRFGLLAGGFLIALGSGGIKPNVASFLGDQLTASSNSLREQLFSWFYVFINGGAIIAFLTAEKLLRNEWLTGHDWNVRVTFGLPGVLMVIATFVLWLGCRRGHYHFVQPAGWNNFRKQLFGKAGRDLLTKVAPLYLFGALFWACFDQSASTWVLQGESPMVDNQILGVHFNSSELQVFNPFFIVVLAPLFTGVFYPWLRRFIPLNPTQKIAGGFILAALAFAIISLLQESIEARQVVSIGWQVAAYLFLTASEILISITLLELGYTAAPRGMKSFVMSFYALSIALGNILTASINKWLLVGLTVASMQSGPETQIAVASPSSLQSGDFIQISGLNGLEQNGMPLMGEFLLEAQPSQKSIFLLKNADGTNVVTTCSYYPDDPKYPARFYRYRLQGSTYFWFFTWMLAGTAILFPVLFFRSLKKK